MQGTREKRIGVGTAVLLLLIAASFDGLQWLVTLIPFGLLLTPVITCIAWLWFAIWFGLLGASVVRYNPLTYFGLLPIEFLPLLNLFPATLMMVALSIYAANHKEV